MNARDRALFDAVEAGNINAVYGAIEAGGDVNCRNEDGRPLIFEAVCPEDDSNRMDIANVLVENGANVDGGDNGDEVTALMHTLGEGQYDKAKWLLDHGANSRRVYAGGMTMLDWAIGDVEIVGELELVQRLLDGGAPVNGGGGSPPIHNALLHMYHLEGMHSPLGTGEDLVNLLLNAGADLQMEVTNNGVRKSIRARACEGIYGERARSLICPNGGKRRRNTRRRNTRRRNTRKNRK